ncbi:MAG: MFS transporter [Alphaproteobacteria bacterium]|nr:MFS transporter [Alphaproteobacteria bacterium]
MTPGARLKAAIEILERLAEHPQPADKALREWGVRNRYAGSKDRAAIREMLFAAIRYRGDAAALMGANTPRAWVLGTAKLRLGWSPSDIASQTGEGRYHAAAVSEAERGRLAGAAPPAAGRGRRNWPDWLAVKLEAAFGPQAEELMAALLEPAPLDIRVNTGMTTREKVLGALGEVGFEARATPFSPWGLRVDRDEDLVGTNLRALPLFAKGAIDIQDEGSQLTALLSGAKPGRQVLDLCAGGGGKTLALAMMMEGKGQIFACDIDAARLKAGTDRVKKADLHNVHPRALTDWDPATGKRDPDLEDVKGSIHLAFVDAPCSGSGAWRRGPDAKWRLTEEGLAHYVAAQRTLLDRAARLLRPGGALVYVTCSLFREENAQQIEALLTRDKTLALTDAAATWEEAIGAPPPEGAVLPLAGGTALQLSPIATGTDGFFFARMEKTA